MAQLCAIESTQCVQLDERCIKIMQVDAYEGAGKGMVHSLSHHEHMWESLAPHVAPTRKIPSPHVHPQMMWLN